ncbi:MAG: ABC transporter substrate-binding protein [Chloroflexota bacterium]|nr:MAG: ABC transporter substrate-binding protein [Chloroflexota bacterium]
MLLMDVPGLAPETDLGAIVAIQLLDRLVQLAPILSQPSSANHHERGIGMDNLTRRQFITLLGLSGVGLSGVIQGCANSTPAASPKAAGSASPSASASAAANLADKQVLIAGVSNMPASLDSMFITGTNARRWDIYEMLVSFEPDGNVKPMLATEYKRLDDTTYEFKLRSGLKFHNGDPLTSSDVKFSLERAVRKEKPLATASIFTTFKSVEAPDPQTVVIKTTVPDAIFVKRLGRLPIFPEKYYMGLGSDNDARDKAFAAAPIGSGPYQLVRFVPNEQVVLKAFPGHSWRKPILTDITIRQMVEPSAQKAALLAGDIQFINMVALNAIPQLKQMGAKLITMTKGNSLGAFIDTVTQDGKPKPPPIGDVRVRQALNYAVDKETLAKAVLGGLTIPESGQIPSSGTYGFDPSVKPYPYDPDKAAKLLDEAGFPLNGKTRFKISMASAYATPGSVRRDIGEYVQAQLQKVGIDVEYTPLMDVALATDYFYNRKARPDILHFGLFSRPYLDPSGAYNWFRSDNPATHYKNPEFDAAYAASEKELDPKKREELLWKCTKLLHDDAPFLFLTEDVWIDAAAPKLEGLIAHGSETEQYYDRLYFVK